MKKSIFAMAAAAPLEMSIATAKRIKQEENAAGPATSAIGPTQLTDLELDMVAAGSAEVQGTRNGNQSTSSDGHGNHNKIQHNFPY